MKIPDPVADRAVRVLGGLDDETLQLAVAIVELIATR